MAIHQRLEESLALFGKIYDKKKSSTVKSGQKSSQRNKALQASLFLSKWQCTRDTSAVMLLRFSTCLLWTIRELLMLWQRVFRSHRTIVIFPLIINVGLYCFRFNGYLLPNTTLLRQKTLCMFSKASFGGFYTK